MTQRNLLIITGLIALVYFGLLSQIRVWGAIPNLLLLWVIIVAVEVKNATFVSVALVAGLIADLYLGTAVGTFTGGFLLVGFTSHALFNKLSYGFTWKHQIVLIFVGTVVASLWAVIYSSALARANLPVPTVGWRESLRTFFPALLYNLAAFYLLQRLFRSLLTQRPFQIAKGLINSKI